MVVTATSIDLSPRAGESARDSTQRGYLRLLFGHKDGRTFLSERWTSAPFGSVRVSRSADVAEVQMTNPAGGVLGGDELNIEASLASGSSVTLLTQGATKIYRGRESFQTARFVVEDDAFLEYLPHHTIPYPGSKSRQRTTFDLAPDAMLIAWEALSAGRLARGERFAFDRFSGRTEILSGGMPLALDGMDIETSRLPEPFEGRNYLATIFVHAPTDLTKLASMLRGFLAEKSTPSLAASASAPRRNLCVVRVLAGRCPELYRTLNECRELVRDHLGHPAPAREVS